MPTALAAVLCAIVYILLIHPLITQHHIFRIVWNYYIYLVSADMVNRCVVFGCSNTPSETVSLHKFTSDKHRRQVWARFLRRTRARWHLKESVFICSKHFFKVRHGIRQEPGVEGNCNSNHLPPLLIRMLVVEKRPHPQPVPVPVVSQLPVQHASGPQ